MKKLITIVLIFIFQISFAQEIYNNNQLISPEDTLNYLQLEKEMEIIDGLWRGM